MKFLKSDVSRNFAIGFIAGALIVVSHFNPKLAAEIVPQAIASIVV